MVGVAGRSKGCGTCRKRRIRCSLQRPQCSNCTKSNRLCTGYQRERVFIINQTEYKGLNSVQGRRTNGTNTPGRHSYATNAIIPSWKQKHKPQKPTFGTSPSLIPTYRQQLLAAFLRSTLPSPSVLGPGFTPWTHHLVELPHHTPALGIAITAVSLSRLSRLSSPPDLTLKHESLTHYTTGLWQLQKALWSPTEMHLDHTLAACLLLAYYELMECPGGTRVGYITHQDGLSRLVQLRGPEAHREGFGHALFVAYRQGAILLAMQRHEPCFLGEERWLRVPYEKQTKGPAERVWDVMAQAPGIYAQTDEMQRSAPVRTLGIAVNVVEYCWRIDEELRRWYEELEASLPGPLYWPELAKRVVSSRGITANPEHGSEGNGGTAAEDDNEPALFPVAYHFINLRIATTLLSYWSLQTLFFDGMRLLYFVLSTVPVDRKAVAALGSAAPTGLLRGINPKCPLDCACGGAKFPDVPCIVRFDTSTLKPLDERINVLNPVTDICQSVEYCTRPEMADLGWTSVVAPLNIALDSIKKYDWCRREADWSRGVLEGFEERLPYLKCPDY